MTVFPNKSNSYSCSFLMSMPTWSHNPAAHIITTQLTTWLAWLVMKMSRVRKFGGHSGIHCAARIWDETIHSIKIKLEKYAPWCHLEGGSAEKAGTRVRKMEDSTTPLNWRDIFFIDLPLSWLLWTHEEYRWVLLRYLETLRSPPVTGIYSWPPTGDWGNSRNI